MKKVDKNTLIAASVMALTCIVSLLVEPSGTPSEGAMCAWIGPLLGSLISVGGSIASAVIGNNATKQQAQQYDKAWANYEDWYKGQMNTSIFDRADTMSMLKNYRDWQDENNKKYQTAAIKGGASEEAKIAYAQKSNEGYADAISQIAAQGQRYKDQLSSSFAKSQFDYLTNRADMAAAGTQAVTNTIANAGGTIADLLGGIDWGKKKES